MRKWPHFCQHYFWQELDGIFSHCVPALHPGQPDWTHDQLFWRQQVWCCYRSQSHLTAGDNHYVSHCILHFYASVTNFICFFLGLLQSQILCPSHQRSNWWKFGCCLAFFSRSLMFFFKSLFFVSWRDQSLKRNLITMHRNLVQHGQQFQGSSFQYI